jgi:CRP/FNR family transcriptional regulator, cyclic AMP receptor protein
LLTQPRKDAVPGRIRLPPPSDVLSEFPGLLRTMPKAVRDQAARVCVARVATLGRGTWSIRASRQLSDMTGLLVLRGVLLRRVGVDGAFGAELLGTGDLLRPWDSGEDTPTLALQTRWRIIQPTRLAILDAEFTRRAVDYPEISRWLVARALRRSRSLAVNLAILNQTRIDTRLHMLLWHLAGRWGRAEATGSTHLPLRLTHSILAELLAARRPTVTTALTQLKRRGAISSDGVDGWVLHGAPPHELSQLT